MVTGNNTLTLAGGVLFAAAILTAQVPGGAGKSTFHVPEGWSRSDGTGSVTMMPPGVPKNLVVLFVGSRAFTGDFRVAFDTDVKGLSGGQQFVNASEVRTGRTREGFELLAVTMELQ